MLEIVAIITSIIIVEIFVRKIVIFTNKNFQWLIIQKDETPKLSEEGLTKFFEHGFDPELGWVRKPMTVHEENGKEGKTKWSINDYSARNNPTWNEKESEISCYGDSFTFSRQVNDDQTWEHFLSNKIQTNVKNFGVGNYGIDQTILRLKREFPNNRTKIVIIGIVPDTISRILSVWKHYYEYGNTFGFKPRFVLKNGKLELIKNFIDEKGKFTSYVQYLPEIKKYDYFYGKKFKKEKIIFPYTISVLKNFKRNISIIFWILKIYLSKRPSEKTKWKPMSIIMKINLEWRLKLYKNEEVKKLFEEIILNFVEYAKEQNFKPVLVFLPQKDDLGFIKKEYHFYNEFVNKIRKNETLTVIDIQNYLSKEENIDEFFSDNNEYGGHYSKIGNKKIAYYLEEIFRKSKILKD